MTTKTDRELHDAVLEELRYQRGTHTELIAHLRSQAINDILSSETLTLDANGQATREYRVPMGAVSVVNHTGLDVWVQAGGAQSGPPLGGGKGTGRIVAGAARTLNLTGHVVTFYGVPGGQITAEIFTKAQPPAFAGGAGATMRPGTPLDAPANGTVGSSVQAAFPALPNRTNWVTGFEATWDGSGTGTVHDVILVVIGGTTFTYRITTVAGVGDKLIVPYATPIPATAPNTPITVGLSALANRAPVNLVLHGFVLP